ncbi:MAG: hypothetical protein JWO32_2662 [Bacteroidetes bacterium]|nr:hypothetical protein [Bacteroidota bacterium]
MNKKVLIIAYSFPPYPGIGGRRWAKFSKYLKKLNTDVHVIASENPFNEESHWTRDTKGISVTRLPLKYPSSLITFPRSISGRINYKLSKYFVQSFTKGNYYDKTLFWKKQLLKAAKEIVEKNDIKNIIVTGAPYHLMHHCLALKEWKPDLNLIVDFRDFWADDTKTGTLFGLSEKRIQEEILLEKEVLQRADRVLTVSEFMTDTLQKKCSINKFHTLINGFDEDDFNSCPQLDKAPGETILFVFTGTLYQNIQPVFGPFCSALQKIKTDHPSVYKKLRFEFYGSSSPVNIELAKGHNIIKFYAGLPINQIVEKITEADYCMLFLSDTYAFSLSTKFCEYIGLRKPIILFTKEGESSRFVETNDLGIWMNPETICEQLIDLVSNSKNILFNDQKEKIRMQFSIPVITKELHDSILI